jgi:hypothetical protein
VGGGRYLQSFIKLSQDTVHQRDGWVTDLTEEASVSSCVRACVWVCVRAANDIPPNEARASLVAV